MDELTRPYDIAMAVLAVLGGAPLHETAARIGLSPDDLVDAVAVYQAAGTAALANQTGWFHARVKFPDWTHAERIAATELAPHIQLAQEDGAITGWWYIRKAPCWRLRARPGRGRTVADVRAAITGILDGLAAAGHIDEWTEGVYEPETAAFGGPHGIAVAHRLFHADSVATLDHLRRHGQGSPVIGRRELSILLCTNLFTAAGQEWYEQGDIWQQVTYLRPLPPGVPADRIDEMASTLYRLIAVDTGPTAGLFTGPLAFAADWASAFTTAGHTLAQAATSGNLERGLRDTLAHHVIFHWNRLGVPARAQSILAHAAREAILNAPRFALAYSPENPELA